MPLVDCKPGTYHATMCLAEPGATPELARLRLWLRHHSTDLKADDALRPLRTASRLRSAMETSTGARQVMPLPNRGDPMNPVVEQMCEAERNRDEKGAAGADAAVIGISILAARNAHRYTPRACTDGQLFPRAFLTSVRAQKHSIHLMMRVAGVLLDHEGRRHAIDIGLPLCDERPHFQQQLAPLVGQVVPLRRIGG